MSLLASERARFLLILAAGSLLFLFYQWFPEELLPADQRLFFSIVLLAIFLWVSKLLPTGYTSLLTLMLFSLFGLAPPEVVFSFWTEPLAYLVIASFFIARAVEKSGLGTRLAVLVFYPFVRSYRSFIITIYLVGILFSLLIPHSFARAFLMLAVVRTMFEQMELETEERAAIGFSVFVASAVNSYVFLTGDSVLNIASANLAGMNISWTGWFAFMGVPSLAFNALVCAVHLIVFPDRQKKVYPFPGMKSRQSPLSGDEKRAIFWLLAAIILWATDSWHQINPGWVAVASAVGMSLPKIGNLLNTDDFNTVKLDILLFMAVALAIGKIGYYTGLNETLADWLFPETAIDNPFIVALLLTLVGMALHFFVGSSFSLVSLMIPFTVVYLQSMSINPLAGAMIVYLTAKGQWFFPFHILDLMIGMGDKNGFYRQAHIVRMGIAMIVPLILAVMLFYVPWWLWTDQFYSK